jgi:hypothetical protein
MMGYRSQVACVISVDRRRIEDVDGKSKFIYDKDKFKEMMGFIKLSRFWELWNQGADQDAIGWRDGKFMLYGADWKWYPDFEDVKAFHNMFNQMNSIEGISGYFLRVGEERDDIEEEEFGDDPCYDDFYAFTAMDFNGQEYLGKRTTDEEEQNPQGELDLPTPTSQGDAKDSPEA